MASTKVWLGVASWLLLASGCGGSGDEVTDSGVDGRVADGALDAEAEDASADSTVPGPRPVLTSLTTPAGIESGIAVNASLGGSGLTSDCVLHLDIGGRSTVLPTTFVNDTTLAVSVSVEATTARYGYGTLWVDDCPASSTHFPIYVSVPQAGWAGPMIDYLQPPSGPSGTSVNVTGTFNASLVVERGALADIPVVANAFSVPADLESGPLAFVLSGLSTDTFGQAPHHTQASITSSATPTASSAYAGYPASNAIDGYVPAVWFPETGNCTAATCAQRDVWYQLDWANAVSVRTVAFRDVPSATSYRIFTLAIETYSVSPIGSSTATFRRVFSMPQGSNDADFTFDPPLTDVRALRIQILSDDSENRGNSFTGSIAELLVFAP